MPALNAATYEWNHKSSEIIALLYVPLPLFSVTNFEVMFLWEKGQSTSTEQ